MTKLQSLLLLIFVAVQLVQSQVPSVGRCPSNIRTVDPFNVESFLGRWYEFSKYPFIFEFNGKCIYAEYSLLTQGKVSVYNFNINRLTNNKNDITGSARLNGPGKLLVTFPNMPSFLGEADYWVLGTDYTNYAVIYSCTEIFGLLNTKVVWILTRQRTPSPEIVETAREIITRNGLSLGPLQRTDQSNCPAQ